MKLSRLIELLQKQRHSFGDIDPEVTVVADGLRKAQYLTGVAGDDADPEVVLFAEKVDRERN